MMSKKIDGLPVDDADGRVERGTGTGVASGFVARLRRLLRCNRGVAAVEFGLSAPLLLGVLVPVADLGMAFAKDQQLQQAVQAGAVYAATHPWNQNASSAIAGAVSAATPLSGISISPSPYQQCGCPSGGSANGSVGSSGITTAICGSTCANGETAGYYAVISAQISYKPILPYSLLGSSTTLTAQSMIRIR
jgi:Flp pilus assembly protein TadG